jgi:microcystin degradation protein MlrC
MSVLGLDDAEADLAIGLRGALGPDAIISADMDLHGNVSLRLARTVDLLTCYRTAPHIDEEQTRQRAFDLMMRCLRDGVRPHKALVHVPILLPGEKTSTRVEPAATLYREVEAIAQREGIFDASVWMGYPWADEPRCQGAVVVLGEQAGPVTEAALELGSLYWSMRDRFGFVGPTASLDQAIDQALAATDRPFFISDTGDNPGAGGADDVTTALARLLERADVQGCGRRIVYASIVDPQAAATAAAAGPGATIQIKLGGRIDPTPPGPLDVTAQVTAVVEDPDGGTCAALAVGPVSFAVTSRRKQYRLRQDYERLGLAFDQADIVVVKIGYLEPDLQAVAAGWVMALTPGGVDQDIRRLAHGRVERPMVPLDDPSPDVRLQAYVW